MKDRGSDLDMRLLLTSNLKKRLMRVAQELRLSLPETVLLAIATQLPNVERLEAYRPRGTKERDDGLEPSGADEPRPTRRRGGGPAEKQGTRTRPGGRGGIRKEKGPA